MLIPSLENEYIYAKLTIVIVIRKGPMNLTNTMFSKKLANDAFDDTNLSHFFYTFFHLVTSKYRRWNVFGDVFRILHVRIMSFYVSDELRRTLSTLPEKLRGLLWVRPFLTLHSEAEMFRTSLEIRIRWINNNKMNTQISLWNQTSYWKILNSFNSIFLRS